MKTFTPLTLAIVTLGLSVAAIVASVRTANPSAQIERQQYASTEVKTVQHFSRVYQPPIRGERSGQQGTRFESGPQHGNLHI